MSMRRSLRAVLVPLGIYLAASLFAYGTLVPGVTVKWHGQRLLERVDLEEAPVRSLLLLHSQPPALNGLLVVCLQISRVVGVPVRWVVTALVTGVAAGSIVLLYGLIAGLTRSRWLAAGAAWVAALDPGFQFFRTWFLAGIFVDFLIAATLFLAFKALDSGDRRALAAAVLAAALLPNTKSVFHPVWALVFALLLVGLFGKIHGKTALARRSPVLLTTAGFLLLLGAWPAKNAYLFGSFTFSSWSGYNVARETPVRSEDLEKYLRDGSASAPIEADVERFRARFGDAQLHILNRPTRADGKRNRNHYAFISTRAELVRKAVAYRTSHLGEWLRSGLVNYRKWTRATFVHPYSEEIRGSWTGPYARAAHSVRAVFFADLGSGPKWTLYGLVLFPGLLALASILTARDLGRGASAGAGISALCLFTLLWHLAVVCLTDGAEGNRLRFGVAPCVLVLAIWVFARGWKCAKARALQSGG